MRTFALVVAALGLLGAGLTVGLVQEAFNADASGLVWVVTAAAVLGTAAAYLGRSWLEWMCDQGVCPMLGLLGTVVGFTMALDGVVNASDVSKLSGIHTALSTTAVGMVAHLYLILLERVGR